MLARASTLIPEGPAGTGSGGQEQCKDMNADEAKQHFTKLAQDAGLPKEQMDAVLQAFENERFRSQVTNGYQRQDEFSRQMDAVRAEKQRLQDWYEKEEYPKYQRYQASINALERYRSQYGELDDGQGLNNGRNGNGNGNGNPGYMSREDVSRYVEEQLKQRDGAYVGLTKSTMKAQADYMRRFKEPMSDSDVDEIEAHALKNNMDFSVAYKDWLQPRVEALKDKVHKEEIERAKAEAVRDYASRHQLPIDTKPQEAHPFWDRKPVEEGKTPMDADRTSREEFMQGWNNYAEELTPKT